MLLKIRMGDATFTTIFACKFIYKMKTIIKNTFNYIGTIPLQINTVQCAVYLQIFYLYARSNVFEAENSSQNVYHICHKHMDDSVDVRSFYVFSNWPADGMLCHIGHTQMASLQHGCADDILNFDLCKKIYHIRCMYENGFQDELFFCEQTIYQM